MNSVKQATSFVLLPYSELENIKSIQLQILNELKSLQERSITTNSPNTHYLTAVEFMQAVKICRSKFDQLSASGRIKVIKKKRKLYVPVSEVNRYFDEPNID